MSYPSQRPRRLRRTAALREMVRETSLRPSQLIAPLFVTLGTGRRRPIGSMPGHAQLSVDLAVAEAESLYALGVRSFLLFGVPDTKDDEGSGAWDPSGPVPLALRALRRALPDCVLMADVCVDEYTAHGHCGVLHTRADGSVDVDNDATVERLTRIARVYAEAGADVVAPSDMMDGRIGAIRQCLDDAGLTETIVLSYAVKYASAFYGPFREAADCAPKFGDRAGYQMDPANAREALRELRLDLDEGADMVMVKPALAYLDVIAQVKGHSPVPVVAYNVSGEYAMLHAAAANGWIDLDRTVREVMTSIVRAGADLVVTYHARDLARALGIAGSLLVLVALGSAAVGCASPPDANACASIQEVSCDGGTLDDASGAWVSSPWTGPHASYPAFTTVRVCHGLGRVPTSVEVWASFAPNGLLAQQIGNVGSVLPDCEGTPGVTDRYVLVRNGGGQDFFARFVVR